MADADGVPAPAPPPWGTLATLAWTLLAAGVSIAATFAVALWWQRDRAELASDFTSDGVLFSVLTLITTPIQVAVLALAARLAGWRVTDYFGLVRPGRRDVATALWVAIVFVLGYDALTVLLGRDVVTPFQIESYYTARQQGALPLLWAAFVIVAPIGEEIMFRGFLYRGWVTSARAVVPAIAGIAAAWAALHVQYDWFGILQVFLIGLLFGWIRWRSGSTLLTILLHGLLNAWATLQTMAKIEWLS